MNLRQIEIFAAVMRSGTASRAAELLGVTQPAVSRTIVEFERAVGFPLFARIRNRLVATPEARILYDDVQAAFQGIDAIRASAARIRDRGSGELRVASIAALGNSLVPKAIASFRQRYSKARITLVVLPSRGVRDLVAAGEYDIGLASDEIDTTSVVHQSFMTRDSLCAVPIAHPLAQKNAITPSDLHGAPFIAYLPENRARKRLEAILESVGSKLDIVAETTYASTALALASEGLGLALISPYTLSSLNLSKVVLKPLKPPIPVKSLLILPPDRPKSQLVRDFIGALHAAR